MFFLLFLIFSTLTFADSFAKLRVLFEINYVISERTTSVIFSRISCSVEKRVKLLQVLVKLKA